MPARLCPVSTGQSIGFFNVQPWSRIPREVHVSKWDHLAGSDHAALWRVPGLGDVEMFRASLSRLIFAAHSHEEYFIAVTEKGRADLRFRDDRHPISSGDVIILNPEEVHRRSYGGIGLGISLTLPATLVDAGGGRAGGEVPCSEPRIFEEYRPRPTRRGALARCPCQCRAARYVARAAIAIVEGSRQARRASQFAKHLQSPGWSGNGCRRQSARVPRRLCHSRGVSTGSRECRRS
jgi:hypothetical protein